MLSRLQIYEPRIRQSFRSCTVWGGTRVFLLVICHTVSYLLDRMEKKLKHMHEGLECVFMSLERNLASTKWISSMYRKNFEI